MAEQEFMENVESLDNKCNKLKHAYDCCFNGWFAEKFLKGDIKDPSPCEAILKEYSNCVKLAMIAKNMDPDDYARHWEESSRKDNETSTASKESLP